ncbi:MAG: hypothetical protein PHC88_13965 [Terrimicrobiaceae bacterium]|nr:hypothetical protein [Terrimicrobiaceae bacterium]
MAALLVFTFTSHHSYGCACGCGIYDVGTIYNFQNKPGGMAWLEYNFQSQGQNWSGLRPAVSGNNDDKLIRTSWLSAGFQYFPSNKWGFDLTIPSANRLFKSVPEDGPPGKTATVKWWSLGDVRMNAYYTGFSPDMSTGVNLGLKVPTGNWKEPGVDRDTQIGTGSTDLLLGFYHEGSFAKFSPWKWFGQTQLDVPLFTQAGYRPGVELDAAAGFYYAGLSLGNVKIKPIGQLLFSYRASDSGPNASPNDSGYERVLLSPGVEFDVHPLRVYADVEIPVIDNVVGNQLISYCQLKVVASIMF